MLVAGNYDFGLGFNGGIDYSIIVRIRNDNLMSYGRLDEFEGVTEKGYDGINLLAGKVELRARQHIFCFTQNFL